MQSRILDLWHPAYGARNDATLARLAVMDVDALASARAVRQPVVTVMTPVTGPVTQPVTATVPPLLR